MPARQSEKNSRFFRLDPSVAANEIELAFDLDPSSRTFSGEARYALSIGRRKRRILLHCVELRVSHVRLRVGDESLVGHVELRPESETVALDFDRPLPSGPAELKLVFRGNVRSDLRGLYCGGGPNDPWIASQLCPTDARRVFPCFDEPGFKARYRIRVSVPAGATVLSNAPVESESTPRKGLRQVQFETTPPLSAYLVAVAVGSFEASEIRRVGTTDLRVYTLTGRESLGAFALEAAAQSLARLEAWFGTAHPYPKLDLVALPEFAFGAMENAGAVFFRDSILLLDTKEASQDERLRAAEVIAHELSHMWFGNLVTMAWWNDLWLNEAFATWMAYEIVDDWHPDWSIWLDFARRREEALAADAMASTHAIAPPIRSAEEAHENFDAITYTKGASVLRMLEQYLGRQVFQVGVRRYIECHRESNATASDLWRALAEASGERIEAIVGPWTLQEGFPLVTLGRAGSALKLRQERFQSSPAKRPSASAQRWPIPWVGRGIPPRKRKSEAMRSLWRGRETRIPGVDAAWLYGNAGESGFFRIEHSPEFERELLARIERLAPAERIGFLGHQWALAWSDRREIDAVLDLIEGLENERTPEVLGMIETILGRIGTRLLAADLPEPFGDFQSWIGRVFRGAFEQVGFEGTAGSTNPVATSLRRARLVSIMGHAGGDEAVVNECERRASRFLTDRQPLPGELAGEILRIAAARGDALLHSQLRAVTRHAHSPQARRRALFALASFRDPELSAQSFEAALDPALAPVSDRAQLIQLLLVEPAAAAATWARLQSHWHQLEEQLPPILLARLARTTAAALPASESPSIRAFFREHPLAAGDRALREISEELASARVFERSAGPALTRYLEAALGR